MPNNIVLDEKSYKELIEDILKCKQAVSLTGDTLSNVMDDLDSTNTVAILAMFFGVSSFILLFGLLAKIGDLKQEIKELEKQTKQTK